MPIILTIGGYMLDLLKAYRQRWSVNRWAVGLGALLSLTAAAIAVVIAVRNEQRGIHDYFHVILATVLVTGWVKYGIDRLTLD